MTPINKSLKILVIVESPSKVHTVSEILQDLGYLKATVMASVGHTTKIKDMHDSYKNTGIYPADNFRAEWEVDPDKYKVVENLKKQARISDLVLIASDPDREGESLGNHIKNLLQLADNQYYRIKYQSITRADIQKALENPEKMNMALCEAAESRQLVDKMIGYALSPVAKAYVGARSVGRCQSAGLKLVADREREIQNFIPEYYYDLFLHFKKNGTDFEAKYIGEADKKVEKISSTEELNDIKFKCTGPYIVSEVKETIKKESPKPPFCTATFQQEAANRLNLKIKEAMSLAQKLFEAGYITYMRTDSTDLAKDFLVSLKSTITQLYGEGFYHKPLTGPKAKNIQEGHEALRITDPALTPELLAAQEKNELLVKVYRLVWQRTIAAALPPAEFTETIYTISNNNQLFRLVSKELKEPGYKLIYNTNNSETPKLRESFKEGEQLTNTKLQEQSKSTQPPARYREATLVKELQKRGIGRPATFATIVETILSPTRGYCEIVNKEILPTDRGMQLSGFLDRAFSNVINLEYTKQLEDSLDAIANKECNKLDFLKDFHRDLENSISNNKENAGEIMQFGGQTCPKCGKEMVIRRSRYGKLFYGCSQYPKCTGILGID